MIVPSPPWERWKSLSASKGYEHVTSELSTKNGAASFPRTARARASGPARRGYA